MKYERIYNIDVYDYHENYVGELLGKLTHIINDNPECFEKCYSNSSFWNSAIGTDAALYIVYIALHIVTDPKGDVFYRNSTTCFYDEFCEILFDKLSGITTYYNTGLNSFISERIYNSAVLYNGQLYSFQKLLIRGSHTKAKYYFRSAYEWIKEHPIIPSLLILFVFFLAYQNFKFLFQDKNACFLYEPVKVDDKFEFAIIHTPYCEYYSRRTNWYSISGYIKEKSEVYCSHCIGKMEVAIFNSYHRKNYHKWSDQLDAPVWLWEDYEIESPFNLNFVYNRETDEMVSSRRIDYSKFKEIVEKER